MCVFLLCSMVNRITVYLVGDGTHFHSHSSLPGQTFSHWVARKSKPMANTRSVKQKSVQHVLVHLCTLEIYMQQRDIKTSVILRV